MAIRTFRDLVAFQRAIDFAEVSLGLGRWLRSRRYFSLATQLERSAISIMANIAEGFGRESKQAFANFLRISLGSLREAEALILLSQRLKAPEVLVEDLMRRADDLGRATFGLRRSILDATRRRPNPTTDDRS